VVVKDETGLLAISSLAVAKAAINLSTSEAYAGETISITGTGFPPRAPLSSITFTIFPSVQLISDSPVPTTNGIGNITFEVQVPWPDRNGALTVEIDDIVAKAPLLIRPASIVATRQDANTILVVGEGFAPNMQARVSVDIRAGIVPNFFTDDNGNISFEITIYDNTQDGTVSVSVGESTASAHIN